MLGEDRKIGLHVGSGNFNLAFFRVIGQFASAEVIRISDGGGSHSQMPAMIHYSPERNEPEIGRNAKMKWVKNFGNVVSPVKLLAEGFNEVEIGDQIIPIEKLLARMIFELRDQAGLFGDFPQCSVAYPEYLTSEQLSILKSSVRAEIPEMEDRHFVPSNYTVLFDIQLHQARYNLGYHKMDYATPKKVVVLDVGENFTTCSLFEISEQSSDLEAKYLSKPCSAKVGGRDFDELFANFLISKALEVGTLTEAELTPDLRRQVQVDADKFKRDLVEKVDAQVISTHLPPGKMNDLAVPIKIYGPSGKKVLDIEVTKKEYENAVFEVIAAISDSTPCVFKVINSVLKQAGMRPNDVDEVIMAGGTTRLHILGQVLKQIFGRTPREFATPELCDVRGAAIYHDMVTTTLEMKL